MATKSFLKNINIKGRKNVRQFVHAIDKIEQSKDNGYKKNPSAYMVTGEKLNSLLSGYMPREANKC